VHPRVGRVVFAERVGRLRLLCSVLVHRRIPLPCLL